MNDQSPHAPLQSPHVGGGIGEREMQDHYRSELRQDNEMLRQALRALIAGPTDAQAIWFAKAALGEVTDG